MTRVGTAHFADGMSEPIETVNPRTVSNNVVGQGDADVPNPDGLSAFMYSWGQFIDHDLDLVTSDGVNHIDITVPNGDPIFPDGSIIPLTRSVIDPATGAGTSTRHGDQPDHRLARRQHGLRLDASGHRSLRLPDGHMKTRRTATTCRLGRQQPADGRRRAGGGESRRSRRCKHCSCASTIIRSISSRPSIRTGTVIICTRKRAPSSAPRSRTSPTTSSCPSCSGRTPHRLPRLRSERGSAHH